MRRVSTFSLVLILLLVAVGATAAVFLLRRERLVAESHAFVDRAVPTMVKEWSAEQLLDRSSPQLRGQLKDNNLAALSAEFARLGPFWHYLGSTGHLKAPLLPSFSAPAASYVARASFAGGLATFQLDVVEHDGRWMFDHFHADFLLIPPMGTHG